MLCKLQVHSRDLIEADPKANTQKERRKVSVYVLASPVKELVSCLLLELFASFDTNSNGILFCPGSLSADTWLPLLTVLNKYMG